MKKKKGKTVDTGGGKKDNEEQSERFVEAAKELDADQTGKAFKKLISGKLKSEHNSD